MFLITLYFDQRKPKKNDQLGNNKFIFGKKLGEKKRPGRDAEYPMLFYFFNILDHVPDFGWSNSRK